MPYSIRTTNHHLRMTTPSDKEKLKKLVEQANKLHPEKDDYDKQIRDALREASQEDIGEATIKALREATADATETEPGASATPQ